MKHEIEFNGQKICFDDDVELHIEAGKIVVKSKFELNLFGYSQQVYVTPPISPLPTTTITWTS